MRSTRTRARHVIEHAVQLHVLVGGQLAVEARILEDDAEAAAHLDAAASTGSRPSSVIAAARRPQQRRQHLDRRGLAGAVRAEEREDLAGAHVERHAVDGAHVAERLDEVFDVNHRVSLSRGLVRRPCWGA